MHLKITGAALWTQRIKAKFRRTITLGALSSMANSALSIAPNSFAKRAEKDELKQ